MKRLPFVVALPIPTKDRDGRLIQAARRRAATETVLKEFDRLFGGAKVLRSPATYRTLSGITIIEEDEPFVLSMTTKMTFLKHRRAVGRLATEVGTFVNQEAMAVIAFDSSEGGLYFMKQR